MKSLHLHATALPGCKTPANGTFCLASDGSHTAEYVRSVIEKDFAAANGPHRLHIVAELPGKPGAHSGCRGLVKNGNISARL